MSRFNFQALPQHASNVAFQPPRPQPVQIPEQNNNYNQKSLAARRQEQQKQEKEDERRETREEVSKLAQLTKAKLRAYFKEQVEDDNDF